MSDTTVQGTVEYIDPNLIEFEDNIRTTDKADPTLVASIREFGVLEPVGCRRSRDGGVIVRMGRRRVLAAREAQARSIPAFVLEGDDSTVQRLLQQYAENEHRAGLTEPERAAVFQQLAFEGLSVPQIAKQTGAKKALVESGIKVAGSEFAQTVATKHEVTLDQAAAILEFEGDKDAVNTLVRYAEDAPEQFAHELQRQRDERARVQAIAAEKARLIEQGFTILESQPDSYSDKEHISLRDLVTADGEPVTVEDLAKVAPRFAHVHSVYGTVEPKVSYYVTEPKGWGFKKINSTGTVVGPMTEEQKAERRTLIANNKAWASAEVVRREWLRGFLARKGLPKDAASFVTGCLINDAAIVASSLDSRSEWACDLLGLDKPGWDVSPLAMFLVEHPAKTGHVALAVIVGAFEKALCKESWRNPNERDANYLTQIEAWGYPLSDVERIITDATKPKPKRNRHTAGKVGAADNPQLASDTDQRRDADGEGEASRVS
jgi:ParB family chromosome partitioning protein